MTTTDQAKRPYWVSWYKLDDEPFELHSPWWVSGYDADDNDIIVAAVHAENERAVWDLVRASYDEPDKAEIRERFADELERETPFVDRFPKAEWMAWGDGTTPDCACGKCSVTT